MSTEVAQRTNGGAVADPSAMADYYSAYGDEATAGGLPFLKFQKGDWTLGQDDKEVPEGTEFVADMGTLKTGWTRWWGGKPTETDMVSVALGQTPRRRHELGDSNPEDWEQDNNGPRDPWQFTNTLELCNPDDADDRVMLSVSSRGGINAVGALCKEYGAHMRTAPDEVPVIALKSDSYKHDKYGKVYVPVLEVTGWMNRSGAVASEGDEAQEEPAPAPKNGGRSKKGTRF